MNNKVIVVAAHPDDEVLGCGATIAKHVGNGDEVHVLILAEGQTSRDVQRDRTKNIKVLTHLSEAAQEAAKVLGVATVTLKDFPDNRMDSVDLLDIVKVVEEFIKLHQSNIVYTHHNGDLNIDHRITNQAVITAARPVPGSSIKTILFFEVPSSTEWQASGSSLQFTPNWFVDISDNLDKKIEALKKYEHEMRSWPFPRSLEAVRYLARWRGSCIGTEAAEAFMLGRTIQ